VSGGGTGMQGRSDTNRPRICEICFDEIPEDEAVVRAARQLDVSLSNPRAGKVDGAVIVCDEKCWSTLRLGGDFRRLGDDED
jgi:hypothetical protein